MSVLTAPAQSTDTLGALAGGDGLAGAINALDTGITAGANPGHTHTLANGATDVTATAAELNTLDGITSTTAELNILDGVTSTATEINVLDGIPATLTATELGYMDGVTSAVQTQIDTKAPTASPTFTGTVTLPTGLTGVLRSDSGVVSTDSDVTDLVSAASTSAAGKVELATDAETLTATSDSVVMTPGNYGANFHRVYKTTNEIVNNSSTLQDDDELSFTVGASESWSIIFSLLYKTNATPDLKVGFTLPTSSSMRWSNAESTVATFDGSNSGTFSGAGTGSTGLAYIITTLTTSGDGGTVQLQWAQNTADPTDTTILAGSHIIATRLA